MRERSMWKSAFFSRMVLLCFLLAALMFGVALFLILLRFPRSIDCPTDTTTQLHVTLPNGRVLGKEQRTFTNKAYRSFFSIPYATPPLGDLRFQAPQPPRSWRGTLNATQESNICFQLTRDSPDESEDCLYINVFTPVLNRRADVRNLPVVLFIYGGGLRNGAARFETYRPEYWMDEDIILVTFNYRLGIFGFLSTGDSVIQGNNGLKDQLLALQWTHNNIDLFGGDPEKITLMGQSIGGGLVTYHMLIKESAGLFRGVIAQSGTPMNIYTFTENPKDYALQLIQAINPNISSEATSEEIRDILLGLDGKTIDSYSRAPRISQPSIVKESESTSSIVTFDAYEKLDSGDFFTAPVMMGINSEEGIFLQSDSDLKELGRSYDEDETLLVPSIFPHNNSITREEIGRAAKLIYLSESESWENNPGALVRQYSDQRYTRSIIKQGKLISKYAPVYFYQFSYEGKVGVTFPTVEGAERVQHGEELNYLFLNKAWDQISYIDILTHKRLMRLWSNFIKYQNPTPRPDDLLQEVSWPTVSPSDFKYLNINESINVETNPRAVSFSKWEKIFETFGSRPFNTY